MIYMYFIIISARFIILLQADDNRNIPAAPPRMDSLLVCAQVDKFCQQMTELTAENMGKLLLSQGMLPK